MSRKVNVLALGAVLFALSLPAAAQQPKKVYRIGILTPRSGIEPNDEVFRERLRELGYLEGQNLLIEWRFTKGKAELNGQVSVPGCHLKSI